MNDDDIFIRVTKPAEGEGEDGQEEAKEEPPAEGEGEEKPKGYQIKSLSNDWDILVGFVPNHSAKPHYILPQYFCKFQQ